MKKSIAIFTLCLVFGVGAFLMRSEASAGKPKESKQQESTPQASPTSLLETMNQLSNDMGPWKGLTSEDKLKAAQMGIAFYGTRSNIAILKPANFYVAKIDETLQQNPSATGMGLLGMLKILSVMEYDFYNGQDKDELAKQVLGEKVYQAIQMRRHI